MSTIGKTGGGAGGIPEPPEYLEYQVVRGDAAGVGEAGQAIDAGFAGAAGAPEAATAVAELPATLQAAPEGSTAEAAPKLTGFQRFWRDFGVNPVAMAKRATVERSPAGGAPMAGAKRADGLVLDQFRGELRGIIESLKADDGKGLSDAGLKAFEQQLRGLAAKYGVNVEFKKGAPTCSWGDFPTIEVERTKGGAHELVHAIQMSIGGVAALGTAAAEKVAREKGRPSESATEIRDAIGRLTPGEKQRAFEEIVKPMESGAYASFEEGAFGAIGFGGSKVRDLEGYKKALLANTDAFCDAYAFATAPDLDLGGAAKTYGEVGHIARTHGETATLAVGGAAAYYGLTVAAMALNPALGAVAMAPLLYGLYRFVRG